MTAGLTSARGGSVSSNKEKLMVSACLLGVPCRYDGKSKKLDGIEALNELFDVIPVCPEVLGGLKIPRLPSERVGDKVLTCDGDDVTDEFVCGAEKTLQIAKDNNCRFAVLKERSPSCGCGKIYDGSFCGKTINGNGVAAELLINSDIEVFGESRITDLIDKAANSTNNCN